MEKSVLSCIQPSGGVHIGNYLGAIQNWVELQKSYQCLYGIADFHAITIPYNSADLKNNTMEMVIDLIACGIMPNNIFIQSLIPEHTELCWILSCVTSFNRLRNQVQFKDKIQQMQEKTEENNLISSGLFLYPVLQAADILVHHADYVPVGKDQEQHLELARDIASAFNQQFNIKYFVIPQCLLSETPKVMDLSTPDKKMSKSRGEKHYIGIFESESAIRQKIRSAVTDKGDSSEKMGAGVENLFTLLKAFGESSIFLSLQEEFNNGKLKYSILKDTTAEAIITKTAPFREKRKQLSENKRIVLEQVSNASEQIGVNVKKTLKQVKEIVGLYYSPK